MQDPETGKWTTGTLRTAAKRLPAIAAMGFDVVYLTPIHPIGTRPARARNNTLDAGPDDPGSPYAIGSPDGGHDAIHPDLGTFEDFDAFVARDRGARHGGRDGHRPPVLPRPPLRHRPTRSGSRRAPTAPSPTPRTRPRSTRTSTRSTSTTTPRVLRRDAPDDPGVDRPRGQIFRVDNPHTKPVEFWQWLIDDVARDHPEVIWLAEAFTKPAMMHTLGKVGFQQSYTYYAWRNQKWELDRVPRGAVRRRGGIHAPVVLAHDARHPHALHAVRRSGRVEAARGARGDARADLRHLRRLRAHRARRPAGCRGADRQREVPVQEPPLGGLRAGWRQGGAVAGRLPHEDQRDPARAPRAALAAQHHASTTSTTRTSWRSPSGACSPTAARTSSSSSPTSTRTARASRRCTSTCPPSASDYEDGIAAQDLLTGASWHWGEHIYVRLGPETEPVHIVAVRRF